MTYAQKWDDTLEASFRGEPVNHVMNYCDVKLIEVDQLQQAVNVKPVNSALNSQTGGSHYKDMAIQPIEFITANKLEFIEGCIVKYICRHENKNGVEDLEKIKHYCDLLIQLKYKKG